MTFCGHVHVPALFPYGAAAAGRPSSRPVPASRSRSCRRGAGSPSSARSASRATAIPPPATRSTTTHAGTLTYLRVPYDIDAAARKIAKAGLPAPLAARLDWGALMLRALEPGQVIDGFRLEEPLHRGGMAMLWRVTHPRAPACRWS